MERRDARLFQQDATIHEGWNIVELESHRQFRQTVNELIHKTQIEGITRSDLRKQLENHRTTYGTRFCTHLVRALQKEDEHERQAVVLLLTILNDPITIPQLQHLSQNKHHSRAIQLSASLALAGMGATRETAEDFRRMRLYAIS